MKKNILILGVVLCIIISSFIFINAVNNDFENDIGGLHQIKSFDIKNNDLNNAKLLFKMSHATKDKVTSAYKVLTDEDPLFIGESKGIDKTLGKYIVEIKLNNVRIQTKLSKELGLKTNKKSFDNELLKNIRIAYPPDDSMVVIYIGFDSKPTVDITENGEDIEVNFQKDK